MIQESQPTFAGIDVGAEELMLVVRKNGTSCKAQKFTSPADRARLVKKMLGMPGIVVCLEATGSIISTGLSRFTMPGWR